MLCSIMELPKKNSIKIWRRDTYKFSNQDINKLILLFAKNCLPYEYIDDWEKFNKILPEREQSPKHGRYYWHR